MIDKIYNWGIIGPGKIAKKFAEALMLVKDVRLGAVASRDLSRAEQFAEAYGGEKAYDNYQALADDPTIDVVYIALPHSFHCEQTIMCLQNKKAVLCEKPLALDAEQVNRMIQASQENDCFLMEALWTRFLPWLKAVLEIIAEGKIGTVKYVRADFGFKAEYNPSGRLFDTRLGGGSLLDIGIYPLFLCQQILGRPMHIAASGSLDYTTADRSCHAILQYDNGGAGIITSMLDCDTPQTAEIAGTEGMIRIPSPWHRCNGFEWRKTNEDWQYMTLPLVANGFEFQIAEVVRCLNKGLTQSPLLSHSFSLQLSRAMDEIKKQIGISYNVGD
ncbi:Gfo/Idh/MocA family protein [Arachidicoccus sp.]|uniref:Gfo/Idh/MocA family protein n=1 Tax=Arachidicoccus sp. TaxID=1872624 RepID=UPI003D1ECA65